MSPVCSNCGASDFVWANDLKTGSIVGGGTLSLRSRGELSLGTRICRACGHADLFLKDPSILRMPHTWRPGEFVPIPNRPASDPRGVSPPTPSPPPAAPSPPSAPAAPAAPPAPPSPPSEPAPVPAAASAPMESPAPPETSSLPGPGGPSAEPAKPSDETPTPPKKGGRRRSTRPKSTDSS